MDRAMISRVRVKNFRSLADVDVSLGRLTVLAGPNGAGKSAFIDTLRFVSEALLLGLESALASRGGFAALRRWPIKGRSTTSIDLAVDAPGASATYGFELAGRSRDLYRVRAEYCNASIPDQQDGYEIRNGKWLKAPGLSPKTESNPPPVAVATSSLALPTLSLSSPLFMLNQYLNQMAVYSISPEMLRTPQLHGFGNQLSPRGVNLASVLRHMQQSESQWFLDLKSAISKVIPEIVDVETKQVGRYLVIQFKHHIDDECSFWLDAAQESDGTLRLLGLLAALYQEPAPSLIALEEPELFIHPGALAVLCDVIREASTRTQIIVSTHSPELISQFESDELRIVERVNGQTEIGPIAKHQRDIINRKLFAPGELMMVQGLERERVGA